MKPQCQAIWFVAGTWAKKTGSAEYRGCRCPRESTHTIDGKPCCWVHFMAANGPRVERVRFVESHATP